MSRSVLLSLLIYVLLLAGIVLVQGEFIALALPLVAYLLIGFLRAPEQIALEATRHIAAERISPHAGVDVTIRLINQGETLEEVLLEDLLPAGLSVRSGSTYHLLRLTKGESYTFHYTVAGPRGAYVFEGLEARLSDTLAVRSASARV